MLLLSIYLSAATLLPAAGPASARGADAPRLAADGDAVACVACKADLPEAESRFEPAAWRALGRGEVVKQSERAGTDEESKGQSRAAVLIDAEPAEVWAVLIDFETWPGFMPHIDHTAITDRDGATWRVRQEFSVLWRSLAHTTVYELDPEQGRLAWRLDRERPHDIGDSAGHWQLQPARRGRATLVRYSAAMDAGRAVPEFVERLLVERSLEDLLTSLRGEVLRRHPDSTPPVAAPPARSGD